jgi:hypothetical protein
MRPSTFLGGHLGIVHFAGTPFFPQRGASSPFLMDQAPLLRENKLPPNLQKGVAAKFHKMKLLPNLTVQKYRTEYRSGGACKVPLKVVFVILKYYL